MKTLSFFLFIALLLTACSKEELAEPTPIAKIHTIRIEVRGDDTEIEKFISINNKVSEGFTGNYTYEYETRSNAENVSVQITSEQFFTNSITIFADGQMMANRAGDCQWTEYSLEHTLVME